MEVPFNIYADLLSKRLRESGIPFELEYYPTDNLWGLFFKRHNGHTELITFRTYGYGSLLETPNGEWFNDNDILVLVKNAYCMEEK